MTREKIINMLAQRIVNSKKITTMQGAVEYVLQYTDEHPKNPWRDAKTDTPKQGENIFVSWINPYGERQYAKCKASVTPTKVILFAGYNCDYWMPTPETPKGKEE